MLSILVQSARGSCLTAALLIFSTLSNSANAQESDTAKLEGYEMTFQAMGSTIALSAYSESEAKVEHAFQKVQQEVERLIAIMSDYDSNSELNRLVRQATVATPVSDELFEVLLASETWHRRSIGAFDASIGNLTRLWREARKRREIPSQIEIDSAMRHSGWDRVALNQSNRTFAVLDPQVQIDLGGIAAGYIVDRAFDILQSHGLRRSLVNAGGDIRCGEAPPGREGWRIEVASMWSPFAILSPRSENRTPKNRQENLRTEFASQTRNTPPPLRRIFLKNAAITTSGDLWQYSEINGQRRSHILDPKTGYGVLGPSVAVVIAPTCIDADASATAISVLGAERGLAMIAELPGFEVLFANRVSASQPLLYSITPGFPKGIYDASHTAGR